MGSTAIRIDSLSKIYRLGEIGTGSLRSDLKRWWIMKVKGQEDPFSMLGQVNDRTAVGQKGDHIWALRDINLEIAEGEVLGIIGSNGAGKSTLLKILSRVTGPTNGSISYNGRIASLLEVGTGFHPELTGLENIYMNGTIMGMTRREIDIKLDTIIDFAGVSKYIDTPVKRYSSGMTVRLGFAVAAHLEPEIMVIDEVLAVGDAAFQKKAIGKMRQVSTELGKTVLFVSHNMAAVKNLCSRTAILDKGEVTFIGNTEDAIMQYLSDNSSDEYTDSSKMVVENGFTLMKSTIRQDGNSLIHNGKSSEVSFEFNVENDLPFSIIMNVFRNGELAFGSTSFYMEPVTGQGTYRASFLIPEYLLNPGVHTIDFSIVDETGNAHQYLYAAQVLHFKVQDDNYRRGNKYNKDWKGAVSPVLRINIAKI